MASQELELYLGVYLTGKYLVEMSEMMMEQETLVTLKWLEEVKGIRLCCTSGHKGFLLLSKILYWTQQSCPFFHLSM